MITKLEKIERDLRKTADDLLDEFTLPKYNQDDKEDLKETWQHVLEAVGKIRFLRTGEL